MLQIHKCSRKDIDNGNFPLNHDSIMKVCYIRDSPIRFEFFSCRSVDTGTLSLIISQLSGVRMVKFSSVDNLPDYF